MRVALICSFVTFLLGAPFSRAEDGRESASQEAVLKADWRSVAEITREWKDREPDSAVAHWLRRSMKPAERRGNGSPPNPLFFCSMRL